MENLLKNFGKKCINNPTNHSTDNIANYSEDLSKLRILLFFHIPPFTVSLTFENIFSSISRTASQTCFVALNTTYDVESEYKQMWTKWQKYQQAVQQSISRIDMNKLKCKKSANGTKKFQFFILQIVIFKR